MINYDDETLQKINENTDLLAYVQRSLTLEQRGNVYFAHCPLHQDKTPSLCFSPEKNAYHCFSCGKEGNMIGYLMTFERMKFHDAVEKAAKMANVDLSTMCQSETLVMLKKWKNYCKLRKHIKFVHEILPDSILDKYDKKPVQEWMDEGIKPEIMDYFGIRIDEFGNRIVYPVYDIDGNLINIKGRTRYENYKELKLTKYINYYKVGVMDYLQCLNKTLPFIQDQHEVIIFESIKSVMKAYGWGYKNCISAETHTLTPEQITLLVKLKVNIVLAYDTDVDYKEKGVKKNIDSLRNITNVFIIKDTDNLLGGADTRNAPVDCGQAIWEELYQNKRKLV